MKRLVFWVLLFGITVSTSAGSPANFFEKIRKGDRIQAEKILSLEPELLDQKDNRGRSAVFFAIESENADMLKFILSEMNESAMDPIPDHAGDYPIHFAAQIPDSRIIELYYSRYPHSDYLNRHGENALDVASRYQNTAVVSFLAAQGVQHSKMSSGPYTISLYFGYLIISILMTIWVARTLFNYGRIFLVKMFSGEEKLADSVNHLLIVGFYLINIGYISLSLTSSQKPVDLAECIEVLTGKVGIVLLILGAMHFFNLFLFAKFRKKISNTFGET
ncbi:ankyrin repeat protein [Leptospira weilii serovar Ranarum str. ICFT]|uniref:Ankyrin repeat protein n=1 Tax=Leptospira weilii serovar Ranarum str. ICFT TaxID=1218598 RepID=N1WK35_9LEPT|nr:ankyrin repeat domain-containing protein [Leptospira weilii]EMY79305.1 ankyrin repeat protein [Leptospira weilii serovar Ranarum str. ICFT]